LLNLWLGFGIKPHPGNWSLMERHIREVLAAGNAPHAEYITRISQRHTQRSDLKPRFGLFFKGVVGISGAGHGLCSG
jgi:hypothetical protein